MAVLHSLYHRHSGKPFIGAFHHYPVPVKIHVAAHVLYAAHRVLFVYYEVAAHRAFKPDPVIRHKGQALFFVSYVIHKAEKRISVPSAVKDHGLGLLRSIAVIAYDIDGPYLSLDRSEHQDKKNKHYYPVLNFPFSDIDYVVLFFYHPGFI